MKLNQLQLTLAGISVLATSVSAQWQIVTDFEGITAEDLNRHFQYPGFGTFYVVPGLDPEGPDNTALYMDAEERGVRCSRIHAAIPLPQPVEPGTVVTLKFDLYQYGSSFDLNVGLSPTPLTIDEETGLMLTPESFADYEAQLRVNTPLDVRDGNNFRPTTVSPPVGEWMTIYMVIDHRDQTVEGYLRRADDSMEKLIIPMPGEDPAKDNWLFRVGTENPLLHFYVSSSNSCERGYDLGDIWLIDEIYIDYSGENLDDGEPTLSPFAELMSASTSVAEGFFEHPLVGVFAPFAPHSTIYSTTAGAWMTIGAFDGGSFMAFHHDLDAWIFLPAAGPNFIYVYGEGWYYWDADGAVQL